MTPDKDLSTQIEQYLNDSLGEVEKRAFEEALANDTALKDQVELMRIANTIVLRNRLWEVKELTKQRIEEGKKNLSRQRWFTGLASLALICGGIMYYTLFPKNAPKETSKTISNISITNSSVQKTPPPSLSAEKPETNIPGTLPEITKGTKSRTEASPVKATSSIAEEPKLAIKKAETVASNKNKPDVLPSLSFDRTSEQALDKLEDICAKTRIDAIVQASGACPDQNNGVINLSNFSGGTKPYKVRFLDEKQREHSASNLPAGTFSVEIIDSKGCTSIQKGIIVKEEVCQRDFELNPDNGDVWEFGISTNPASLSVYDQNEILYFYKKFETGETIKWNGLSIKGEVLPGYYLFVLKNQDGKTVSGSFTIVR